MRWLWLGCVFVACDAGTGILFEIQRPPEAAALLQLQVALGQNLDATANATSAQLVLRVAREASDVVRLWPASDGTRRLLVEDGKSGDEIYAYASATDATTIWEAVGHAHFPDAGLVVVPVTLTPSQTPFDAVCPHAQNHFFSTPGADCDQDSWPYPEDCADWDPTTAPTVAASEPERMCCNQATPAALQRLVAITPAFTCDIQASCKGGSHTTPWLRNELLELYPYIDVDAMAGTPRDEGAFFCQCLKTMFNLDGNQYPAEVNILLGQGGGTSRPFASCTSIIKHCPDDLDAIAREAQCASNNLRMRIAINFPANTDFQTVLEANPKTVADLQGGWSLPRLDFAGARGFRIIAQDGGIRISFGAGKTSSTTSPLDGIQLEWTSATPRPTVDGTSVNGIWANTGLWALIDGAGMEHLFVVHVHLINQAVGSVSLSAETGF